MFGVDYMLMNRGDNFSWLRDNDELELITTEVTHSECGNPTQNLMKSPCDVNSLANYDILQIVGKGGFSIVYIVRCKRTAKIYAMKSINEKVIRKWSKYDNMENEKHILMMVHHPFIISLAQNIECENYINWVIDFWPGGDLFYWISKNTRLSEEVARFYICEIIIALEYLHSLNILYRDLKPTNVLIDAEGHIKLTDFGLSLPFFTEESVSSTFCGTPEYMSPEMLLQLGHNRWVDFYSLGVTLYEMLVGVPPFYNSDRKVMYTSILKDEIKFYRHMSKDAKDLIDSLMTKDPRERLGANYGFFEIKQHPFFSKVNWKKFESGTVKPPLMPPIRETNFSDEFTSIHLDLEFVQDKVISENVSEDDTAHEKKIDFGTSHSTKIDDNRKEVEEEFYDWYNDLSTRNLPNYWEV